MNNIVYLFGAGASIGAIPAANSTAKDMKIIAERVQEVIIRNEIVLTGRRHPLITEMINFSAEASLHRTVDTYAKKLYAREEIEKFKRFKIVLSAYFTFQQLITKGKCDSRYDGFWASLIEDKYYDLPTNIKIITWNYDSQMELSFSEYCNNSSIKDAKSTLNIRTNSTDYTIIPRSSDKFSIHKLNGTANVLNGFLGKSNSFEEEFLLDDYREGLTYENIQKVFNNYERLTSTSDRVNTSLSFAWEYPTKWDNHQIRKTMIYELSDIISNHEVLVVIGYSFPFFNRNVDRLLFSTMNNLRAVYIQDPNPRPVMESFKSVSSINMNAVYPIEFLDDQFFLPPEL